MSGDDGDAKRGARDGKRRTEHFSDLKTDGPNESSFIIQHTDLCFVNAIRRAVISNVQNVAVDFDPTNLVPFDINNPLTSGIYFKKNTSVIDNEKLGRQIALIPICVDENRLQGYDPNTFKFLIKVKNTSDQIITVKSNDIRVLDSTGAEVQKSVRDALFPACPITKDHIIVVRLKPSPTGDGDGEEIDVEFRARLGTGRENACWSPTNKCVFGFVRDEKISDKNFESFIENMRKDYEEGGAILSREEIARVKKQYLTSQGQRDYAVDVDDNPLAIQFTIETVNRLDPAFVFFQGIRVLSRKVKDLKAEIAKITAEDDDKGWGGYVDEFSATPPRVKIVQKSNMDDMFEITVHQEDDTLGNLVQGLLYRHWNLKGNYAAPKGAAFFGYNLPHPLEDHIVFHIKVNAGDKLGRVMEDGLSWCIKLIDELSVEFAEFSNIRKIKFVDEILKNKA